MSGLAWGLNLDFKQLTKIAEIPEPVTARSDLLPSRWVDYQLVARGFTPSC